jgi:hypothetical protein
MKLLFATKDELFAHVGKPGTDSYKEKLKGLIAQKKMEIKWADGFHFNNTFYCEKENSFKSYSEKEETPIMDGRDTLGVKAIINTTNIIDSHMDMHIPKIWDISLKQNKQVMHLQEHKNSFDTILSSGKDLKAYTETYTWKELGFKFDGKTQALEFDSTIKASRNSGSKFMIGQYANKYVNNHSVGMYYVRLIMCIGDENYGAEYEAWEKYLPMAVNPEVAEDRGYFWAVTEAKCIEGSAVPLGSNYATPTISIEDKGAPENHKPDDKSQKALADYIDNFKFSV